MLSEIICIGDELLVGQVINTNAAWLSEQLYFMGAPVQRTVVVADDYSAIKTALAESMARVDLVVLTGGLGPTKDDITKSALCDFFESSLIFNDEVLQNITRLFYKRGISVSETNRKQAEVPNKAQILKNSCGTAPGMWFEKNNRVVVSLPGVPFEMKSIFSEELAPKIQQYFNPEPVNYRTVHIAGMAESHLSDMLESWESFARENFINVAYLPQPGIIRLRLSTTHSEKYQLIERLIEDLKPIIGDAIFGYDNITIQSAVGKILLEKSLKLATAESCTGGNIAAMITSVAGSSAYFNGSVVAYDNSVKKGLLGVSEMDLLNYGAVSEQVVKQMVAGVIAATGSDVAIAISGIAGPDGGTPEKPVGTVWLAVGSKNKCQTEKLSLGHLRDINIARASVLALNSLRKFLMHN